MRGRVIAVALFVTGIAALLFVGAWKTGPVLASDADDDARVTLRDDCDPTDPDWAPTGGCALRRGDVNVSEFRTLLRSPLANATIGHPAWRNDPSYLKIEANETVEVRNRGGRTHTFTEVAQFGGGRVPPLNFGLQAAPECSTAVNLPPGAETNVTGLSIGDHRFQCCVHPWMRTLIKVKPNE